ncbi:hypothetical protein M413DRAFT_448943 [Hebeloma cylindrosporum]|uniref:Uncharacterized protein n=1 Tax=Hebeloma cylindrosporum TaxID=76867 RepID=A0A0C3BXM0_HEBCY|nr:hypothetical protein M413DRAFT_448943 [Hebeloma cylindrosporum h7]
MGEFFFSEKPGLLIDLLATPAVPLNNASSDPSTKKEVAGAWAGDRIICLGDYSRSWPDGVVSAADFLEPIADEDWQDPTKCPSGYFSSSCNAVRSVDFGHEKLAAYPEDEVWLLRNISKKLYVRSDGIPANNTGYHLTYEGHRGLQRYPGLGSVLVANIGWSEDGSTAMPWCGCELTTGSWAGDRIDVCLMDHVIEVMSQERWKDISRQEAVKLHGIWRDHEGGDGTLPDEPKAALEDLTE